MLCDTCPNEIKQLEPVSISLDLGNQVTLYLCDECEALIDLTLTRERRKFFKADCYADDPVITLNCQQCGVELTPSKSGEFVIGSRLICAKCLRESKLNNQKVG